MVYLGLSALRLFTDARWRTELQKLWQISLRSSFLDIEGIFNSRAALGTVPFLVLKKLSTAVRIEFAVLHSKQYCTVQRLYCIRRPLPMLGG